jgi:hypothetical protein
MMLEVTAMSMKLVSGACLAVLLAACSGAPTKPDQASVNAPPVGCVSSNTATRLPAKPTDCNGFGSTWTKQDLDRTGQPYVGDALRMLDPSVTVHGGP